MPVGLILEATIPMVEIGIPIIMNGKIKISIQIINVLGERNNNSSSHNNQWNGNNNNNNNTNHHQNNGPTNYDQWKSSNQSQPPPQQQQTRSNHYLIWKTNPAIIYAKASSEYHIQYNQYTTALQQAMLAQQAGTPITPQQQQYLIVGLDSFVRKEGRRLIFFF